MKKILAVLVVLVFLSPAVLFAADDVEKLKADYQEVVKEFGGNLQTQQLLVEGFKQTNATYQALVARQLKLQKMAKNLADKIQKMEAPSPDAPEAPEAPELPAE